MSLGPARSAPPGPTSALRSASPARPPTSDSVPALVGSPVSASTLRLALTPVSVALRLMLRALRPVSGTLTDPLRVVSQAPAMHDTTTSSNRCRRRTPVVPIRVTVPRDPPRLTAGAAAVLLEMVRATRQQREDQAENAPDAA